ncbi:MAG: SDR family NAD(P)-dependent oxidoreductase [Alphaproteobacteria bacterium]|nr:SDR family NAD(P)-dependent oxidoreductase [Alphaproteobacteria bacterium]
MFQRDWGDRLVRKQYEEFANQHIIIAGGATGIGEQLVSAFHWLGARVSVLDKDKAPSSRDGRVRCYQANLAVEKKREKAIQSALNKFGNPKIFISTVGIDERVGFDALTQDKFEKLYAANFIAPFFTAKSLLKPMREGGGGTMCLFTSEHGSRISEPDLTPYGIAKASINNAVPRLAAFVGEENSPDNYIRIFAFCPGWTQTENQKRRFPQKVVEDSARKEHLIPLVIQPEDMVEPVLFNVSDRARFCTDPVIHTAGMGHRRPDGLNAKSCRADNLTAS